MKQNNTKGCSGNSNNTTKNSANTTKNSSTKNCGGRCKKQSNNQDNG